MEAKALYEHIIKTETLEYCRMNAWQENGVLRERHVAGSILNLQVTNLDRMCYTKLRKLHQPFK